MTKTQTLLCIMVIFTLSATSFGRKNQDPAFDQPKPDPKFTALDDATKIQLEIERQTLTQTIDNLKNKLNDLDKKEKTQGSLDEASEDERDRIREQLDSLYKQRNDLLERIQKKIDEHSTSSNKKSVRPDDVRQRDEEKRARRDEEKRARRGEEKRARRDEEKRARRPEEKRARKYSEEMREKHSRNPRKYPKISDEI